MRPSEQIYGKLVRMLVEALNVDESDVRPDATLVGDLGAESIDMLDITFRLEREFDIRIPHDELFPDSIFQGDAEFVRDGTVTEAGIKELRGRMPYADLGKLERDPRLSAVPDLFTVDLIGRYVAWKLATAGTPDQKQKVSAA